MTLNILATAAALSDDALLARVQVLAGRERQATCELIAHLAELDTRKVLVAEGYSLFTYCTGRLGLSEDAAYTRVEVARAARRFPVVLDGLADGSWTVTTIRLLGRHLTTDNHERVLDEARHRSKREVELLVARLAPRPDAPSLVRKLPVGAPLPRAGAPNGDPPSRKEVEALVTSAATTEAVPAPAWPAAAPAVRSAPAVSPLSPERYRVQLTVGQETHDKLRRLQDLLRREVPSGDPALIVDRALTLLLQAVEKRKLAATSKPRGASRSRTGTPHGQGTPATRHVPAAVRRAVWKRDGDRCGYISPSGHRCSEKTLLEIHHRHPYALGGPPALANLGLRCRRHNVYEAEQVFGPGSSLIRKPRSAYGDRSRTTGGAVAWGPPPTG
jgi:5-methylcytosine-specific restriction endonuclease McrA